MDYISYIFVLEIFFVIITVLDSYVISDGKPEYDELDDITEFETSQPANKERRSLATNNNDELWDGGIIPYEIHNVYTGPQRKLIRQAMQHWEQETCLKFVPKIEGLHENYLSITKASCGCCSFVGNKRFGGQLLSLLDGCINFVTIVHELGHAIGLHHEHERPDRDDYIEIVYENIMESEILNFVKESRNETTTLGQAYDYSSVMHYGDKSSAKEPGLRTIKPLKKIGGEWPKIGSTKRLSRGDVVTANLLYHCPECGGTFSQPKGIFSPSISKLNSKRCEWTIRATEGQRIKLSIAKFSIPESPHCLTDYLEIQNIKENNHVIARYCGKIETTLVVNSNILEIVFVNTQYEKNSVGFIIEYEAICGKNISIKSNETLNLESPNYPEPYGPNKQCYWYINAPDDHLISLKFYHFDIEDSPNCKNDYLEVRNGENDKARLLEIHCGKYDNLILFSSGRHMFVKFISNESINVYGFSAAITALENNYN